MPGFVTAAKTGAKQNQTPKPLTPAHQQTGKGGAGLRGWAWLGAGDWRSVWASVCSTRVPGRERTCPGWGADGPEPHQGLGDSLSDQALTETTESRTCSCGSSSPFQAQVVHVLERLKVIIRRCDKEPAWKHLSQTLSVCLTQWAWAPHFQPTGTARLGGLGSPHSVWSLQNSATTSPPTPGDATHFICGHSSITSTSFPRAGVGHKWLRGQRVLV